MITLTVIGEKIIVSSLFAILSLSNETPKIVAPIHKQQQKIKTRGSDDGSASDNDANGTTVCVNFNERQDPRPWCVCLRIIVAIAGIVAVDSNNIHIGRILGNV